MIEQQEYLQDDNEMLKSQTKEIVENFYQYFTSAQLEKLYTLIADDIKHEINQDGVVRGKEKFIAYIEDTKKHYEEHFDGLVFMISDDGRHASTKFRVKGKCIHTDEALKIAKGQSYELSVLNYFEIENGKIVSAGCWFDQNDFERQTTS